MEPEDNLPSEDELAALAYQDRLDTLGDHFLPPWETALEEVKQAWINRVGGYLELRWAPKDDRDAMDPHVRKVCEARAFPAGEE